MSGLSYHRFDLNLGEEASMPSPDNIWRPSFISPTGHFTVGDLVMKNDMIAAVVARNLVTLKDNRLLSKRSDELAVKDSLALSVQCILLDHQRFVGLFQQHLPSSSEAIPGSEAPNDQPSIPPHSVAPPTTETSPKKPL
ncbi:hypothetical protein PS1_038049 [Malus domestica]